MRSILASVALLILTGAYGAEKAPARRAPTLALLVTHPEGAPGHDSLEDILFLEISSQPYARLVERAALRQILKEHELNLSGLVKAENAVAAGKLIGADFLLFATADAQNVAVRLIDAATGKVRLEDTVPLGKDPFLAAAAVREKMLKALGAEPEGRITVGIAAFPNRSGTDRTDKLGLRLQELLRTRLRQESWATILERQYPAGLLEEAELARLGLAKGHPENLPPADLVICGTMEDASREYRADQPWEVKLDLSFRLGKKSTQLSRVCKSNDLEGAAEEIAKAIQAFRQEGAAGRPPEPEKDFWRRQAFYHMPRSSYAVGREPYFCGSEREKLDAREAIRAWENLLLLNPDDPEAKLNLGVCLVSRYRIPLFHGTGAELDEARRQAMRGTLLVESAVRAQPIPHNATTFYFTAGTLRSHGSDTIGLPQRTAEMYDYILANPKVFADYEARYARIGLASIRKERMLPELDRAAADVEKDPAAALSGFGGLIDRASEKPDEMIRAIARFCDSPNPLLRFAAERTTAEILMRYKKDPSALDHYDRAIAVSEDARGAFKRGRLDGVHTNFLDDIYRSKIVACQVFKQAEAERRTALDGARRFMALGRYSYSIAWLYSYCVTKVLREGEEKEALAICNTYLSAADQNPYEQNDHGARILDAKLKLEARVAGTRLPGFEAMALVKGTEVTNLHAPRMAVAGGKLWLAWQPWQSGGPALVYQPGSASAQRLAALPDNMRSVAAVGDRVFFGGYGGLFQLDTSGKIVKSYSKKGSQLPADALVDLCAGGGKLYMSFRESDRYGVAVLDPATDAVSVLAPTVREARLTSEPVYDVYRVWWDSVHARLFANAYFLYGSVIRPSSLGWFQSGNRWLPVPAGEPFLRYIISDGDEALQMSIAGKTAVFEFLKAQHKVQWAYPLPVLIGEPAWDNDRIWVPAHTGLYELDRATGNARWLAHQDDTACLAVLRHGGKLYVATTRGLYSCDIPIRAAP